jgi:hypothetical protein
MTRSASIGDDDNSDSSKKPKSNSLEVFRERWQRQLVADKKILLSDLKVALAIAWHINRDERRAWPGTRTLQELTGLSRPTVISATMRLEKALHLEIYRSRSGNRRNANRYRPLLKARGAASTNSTRHTSDLYHVANPSLYHRGNPQDFTRTSYLTSDRTSNSVILTATVGTVAMNKGFQERKEDFRDGVGGKGIASIESPLFAESPLSKAYRIAESLEGDLGRSSVALADRHGGSPDDILFEVESVAENGGDLGEALCQFWKESW